MSFYTKISDPKGLRISILEAAKETLTCMAQHKTVISIREEKQQLIHELKEDLIEISKLCTTLEEYLPHKELKKEAEKEEKERKKQESADLTLLQEKRIQQKLREMQKEEPQRPKAAKPIQQKPAPKPTPTKMPSLTDVDRLEYTLKKIEQKLADLNDQ